jgi:hypothetical protein
LAFVATVCAGQTANRLRGTLASTTEQSVADLGRKISQLLFPTPREQQLLASCRVDCSTAQVQRELDRLTAEREAAIESAILLIHAKIDDYITRTINLRTVDSDRTRIEGDLKQILASVADMPPVTFGSALGDGYSLLLAYSLREGQTMGPGATSVTVRAYRANGNRVELVDATGSDMDGYGRIRVQELRSPTRDEAWFVVSGYMTGANGPNVRMRVYAYHAGKFRTAWMPENVWGDFRVQPTDRGFTVEGSYYRDEKERRDSYRLAPDGIYLDRSEH